MKFTLAHSALVDAVALVARSLPSRPPTPILGGIKLAVEGGTLTVSGFDYEVSTKAMAPTEVTNIEGSVLVSGRLLAEITKALPAKKPVTVHYDGNRLGVTAGSAKFSLPVMPVQDYPELPAFPKIAGSVSAEEFNAAVTQIAVAVARDDTVPMLTGIRLEAVGGTLTMVATDRYRLAVREVEWTPNADTDLAVLVPAKTMVEAAKVPDTGEVDLCLTDSLFGVSRMNWETTTRLLDAEYPPYRKLITTDFTTTVTVDTAELAGACKRMALVSTKQVRCELNDGVMRLSATGVEVGEATEYVECEQTGPDMTIGFNPGYLGDGLYAARSERVLIGMVAPTRPTILQPLGDDPGFLYVLMPVRL